MIKTPSLIAAYNFNGSANDESGNGYNCAGTATFADSQFGQCANFDGSQYLSTQNNVDLSSTDKLTICFWLKFAGNSLQFINEISSNFNSNNAFDIRLNESGTTPGSITFYDHNFDSKNSIFYHATTTTKSYNDNKWHYTVITTDRSLTIANKTKIYVDLFESSINLRNGDIYGNYSSFPIFLGSRNNSQYFFNGQLDRFRIYNKILSFEDIKRIYEGFSPLNG